MVQQNVINLFEGTNKKHVLLRHVEQEEIRKPIAHTAPSKGKSAAAENVEESNEDDAETPPTPKKHPYERVAHLLPKVTDNIHKLQVF